jgi:hypothetical protein
MDADRSRKYTAVTIVALGSLLLVGVVGLFIILTTQPRVNTRPPDSEEGTAPATPTSLTPPARDEVVVTPTLEMAPTKADVETRSTQIIAPLLSFSERIATNDEHYYLFQAVADTPLLIKVETTFDMRLQMQIVDRGNNVLSDKELARGLHEIIFNPDFSGEYRIKLKAVEGQGEYTISMAFATKEGSQL